MGRVLALNTPTLIVLLSMCAGTVWGMYCGHTRKSHDALFIGGSVIALVMMLALVVAVK